MKIKMSCLLICVMLATISFVPNMTANGKIVNATTELNNENIDSNAFQMNNQALSCFGGWQFLEPQFYTPIGFTIVGKANSEEAFNSLTITKTTIDGNVPFFFKFKRVYDKDDLYFKYWCIVHGNGIIEITCKWHNNGQSYECGGHIEVHGLFADLVPST